MAELTPKERLQPSLLDRLTDENPERLQESRERRVLSPQRLRESVRRDLTYLLNSTCLTSVQDLGDDALLEGSTVNYGLPDLTGHTASTIHVPTLEKVLRRVIIDFEPRLIKNSVRVRLLKDADKYGPNALVFGIEAELWAQPLPLRLFLRTDIDLETGDVMISEAGGERD
ncbi:MAG: type VI secretion system baseplate subunit TssE [Pseudomonadota bacterium]|nr:MAG: type VI secretion system baseplate subunit TssE [Pseudomonadota bacterium]